MFHQWTALPVQSEKSLDEEWLPNLQEICENEVKIIWSVKTRPHLLETVRIIGNPQEAIKNNAKKYGICIDIIWMNITPSGMIMLYIHTTIL